MRRQALAVFALALAGVVAVLAGAGCDLRPLARGALMDLPDAASAAEAAADGIASPEAADDAAGLGMLSGVVRDACTGQGIDARVGIADRRKCSYVGKGSYFFAGLPLGTLRLAAMKDGYELYTATVEITAGGTVQDIELVPTPPASCAAPPPPVACTCLEPGCEPPSSASASP